MESAKLYYEDGSPFSRLCRTLIIDWELPVETIELDWPLSESIFEENPLGQVPTLKTIGETIFPTSQITEQLLAMTVEPLAPYFDPLADRQLLITILSMGDAMIASNAINKSGLRQTDKNTYGIDIFERNKMRIDHTLAWLEKQCEKWLVNEKVSVCDYALACLLLWSDSRSPVDWRKHPKITRIVEELSSGDSFAQTVPNPWVSQD
ncbi:glutathione S-transferase family protein [Amylibacter sp.]|nr:glutathione S-transferase family protein [Amylibacter sp.]MDA9781081.1 glutathione S-transferase family protein [Amylibacter sp.]MDB4096161.1 glutathione S-transferase family protein [Amylibacter sp.]MDB9816531.1 glutathione S-transferase family protein [Amylibacter sp.]